MLTILSACGTKFSKNVLFKSIHDKKYEEKRKTTKGGIIRYGGFDTSTTAYQYHIQIDDEVSIRLMNNIDFSEKSTESGMQGGGGNIYKVDALGNIYLPMVGTVFVLDKTILELRYELEKRFREFIREPIIEIQVPSMRVYLFAEESHNVVKLPRERTNLIEILAQAGGLKYTSKSYKIKIIRGSLSAPQIIWVDFTRLDVLGAEDLIMHANDIIYIEPRTIQLILREIQPYLAFFSLITTIPSLYFLLNQTGIFR